MTKPVRPNTAAERDIRLEIRWYEDAQPGLGDRLWSEVQAAIELIGTYPRIGEVVRRVRVRGIVRRVPLRRFPFFLVYREHEEYVEVVALAHTSRKPGWWRNRVE